MRIPILAWSVNEVCELDYTSGFQKIGGKDICLTYLKELL